ncbi:MAG: hypothetical protein M1438_02505 [Deltaproteobacteria bacterium]|nr:hypothetical protein [Deltaproteobacteria bacterium]
MSIPVSLLKKIEGAELETVERRKGKQSLAKDVYDQGKKAFRILFDAADGKCTVRGLALSECQVLTTFDILI